MQMVYSLTQHTEFCKVFFTLKLPHVFTAHMQMQFHLHQ